MEQATKLCTPLILAPCIYILVTEHAPFASYGLLCPAQQLLPVELVLRKKIDQLQNLKKRKSPFFPRLRGFNRKRNPIPVPFRFQSSAPVPTATLTVSAKVKTLSKLSFPNRTKIGLERFEAVNQSGASFYSACLRLGTGVACFECAQILAEKKPWPLTKERSKSVREFS